MANEKRLIDANALISHLRTFKGLGSMVAETLVRFVEKQPTVDAVEVVRCKNCKVFVRNSRADTDRGDCYRYGVDCVQVKKIDDFCSYGERKRNDI